MRGRKPTPPEEKIRQGNPGRRPIPEPILVGGRPDREEIVEPPEHLDPEAHDFWVFAVERLTEVGIIDRVDIPVLEQLATQYARIRQAQRAIKKYGHFTRGSTGQIVAHPAVKMEQDATNLFLKIAEHYALTPVARTRLGLAELQARSMAAEMDDRLGTPDLTPA
jgi:P27 family predicted phage terminase small subunit